MEKSLVSFDIWDTVLRRRCHPDETKLFTAKQIVLRYGSQLHDWYHDTHHLLEERRKCEWDLGQRQRGRGGDDEYEITNVLQEMLSRIFLAPRGEEELRSMACELARLEMEQEKSIVYLDDQIVSVLQGVNASDAAFISDFYAGEQEIRGLLEHVKFPVAYQHGYVSCDHGLNKRTGNLFPKVHQDLGITGASHIHFGDNAHSDVASPLRYGIQGRHFRNEPEEAKRARLEKKFRSRMKRECAPYVQDVLNQLSQQEQQGARSGAEREMYRLGQKHSLIFYAFVLEILEDAKRNGYSTVYYMTREGEFFKAIHDLILQQNPHGAELPASELLEVSRMATFSASLREVTLQELMRVWNQYSTQSMQALFKTLDVPIEPYLPLLQQHGVPVEAEIQYPWQHPGVVALFEDPAFVGPLSEACRVKQENLKSYFAAKGITEQTERAAIVDIGWRGTIQDNIAHLYPHAHWKGYYFGLFSFINQQPPNVEKQGFVPPEHAKALRYVSPIEMLCNSPSGSVLRYEPDATGTVRAVKLVEPEENKIHDQYVAHFQAGVRASVPAWCECTRTHALMAAELKPDAMASIAEMMMMPPSMLAHAYFQLSHNETFGLGRFVDKRVTFPYKLFAKALVSIKGMKQLRDYVKDSGWPQGYLNQYGLSFLTRLYNSYVRFKTRKQKSG